MFCGNSLRGGVLDRRENMSKPFYLVLVALAVIGGLSFVAEGMLNTWEYTEEIESIRKTCLVLGSIVLGIWFFLEHIHNDDDDFFDW